MLRQLWWGIRMRVLAHNGHYTGWSPLLNKMMKASRRKTKMGLGPTQEHSRWIAKEAA